MAYDLYQKERIDNILDSKGATFVSKNMMGGLCYMMDGKMLCGLIKNQLMARIGMEAYATALEYAHVLEMNFTGRPMKGYVFVNAAGIDMEEDLDYWLQLCIDYNPIAKASKKKKSI